MFKLAVAAAIGLLALPALAQRGQGADRVRVKNNVLDFDEAVVRGVPESPPERFVVSKPHPVFKVLIPVRANFLPELRKSADNL